jgi:hypothetical protein
VTTNVSIQELVRKDLLWSEQYSSFSASNTSSEALLDAYESCLELAMYIRQLIEETAIGNQLHRAPRSEEHR